MRCQCLKRVANISTTVYLQGIPDHKKYCVSNLDVLYMQKKIPPKVNLIGLILVRFERRYLVHRDAYTSTLYNTVYIKVCGIKIKRSVPGRA